jgi:Ala-tRNA(Pro) deacylase
MKYLGLTPGSVSPFGLINDTNKEVNIIVDNDLISAQKQAFHPNINTSTLVISTDDFRRFLDWTGNNVIYMDL